MFLSLKRRRHEADDTHTDDDRDLVALVNEARSDADVRVATELARLRHRA